MKHLFVSVVAGLALALAGCGGSGSDHKSTGGTTTADLGTPRIEAVVRIDRANLKDRAIDSPLKPGQYTDDQLLDPTLVNPADLVNPSVYGVQDLHNFQTAELFQFQLVAYENTTGKRVILPASFTTDDTDHVYGTLGDSGRFDASSRATPGPIFAYANYEGTRYFAEYEVQERQARVLGHVKGSDAGSTPFQGAIVEFYDDLGRLLASVKSGYDGSFRGSVPLNATSFTINAHALVNGKATETNYFPLYTVNGKSYNAGEAGCRTPISEITTDGSTMLVFGTQSFRDIVISVSTGGSIPDATGCVG